MRRMCFELDTLPAMTTDALIGSRLSLLHDQCRAIHQLATCAAFAVLKRN
jgi:hypothetical protein